MQNFTRLCESVPPTELVPLVADILDVCTSLIVDSEGIVHKFIGDCIMALWRAPQEVRCPVDQAPQGTAATAA